MDRLYPHIHSDDYTERRLWVFNSSGKVLVYHEPTPHTDELVFTFWGFSSDSWDRVLMECMVNVDAGRENIQRMDRLCRTLYYFRYHFRSWNLDVPMFWRDDGGLDDESLDRLLGLHPRILRELAEDMDSYGLSDDDMRDIAVQSHQLFARGNSVENPHPMVRLYCTLAEMWDKFGLNYFDLKRLPLYERNALRTILSQENQIRNAEIKNTEAKSRMARRGMR